MHYLEPFYNWRDYYTSEEDEFSPFYQKEYNEFEFENTIYNYYIHPQWDDIGSPTLYIKILFADYEKGYAILELIGEWNDCINNDIMLLKRDIIDNLIDNNITKFILIGENVLNFHYEGDDYYQEWFEDVENGWITFLNFREHILSEFNRHHLDYYINFGGQLDQLNWRNYTPFILCKMVNNIINNRLNT